MCIVFLWKQERNELIGKFKLILAANRDEYFFRNAKPAHFWEESKHVLAGRDLSKELKSGFGTWLGVTKQGKLSFLTNFPAGVCKRDSLKGRGELIANFLKSSTSGKDYLNLLQEEKKLYGPFNLVCGHVLGPLFYTRNVLDEGVGVKEIKGGFTCMDNDVLGCQWKKAVKGFTCMTNDVLGCQWKKAVKGTDTFANILEHYSTDEDLFDGLLDLLDDKTNYHPDEAMPVYDDYNEVKASVHVPLQASQYGTRTNTLIAVDDENNLTFLERTKTELNQPSSQWLKTRFKFKIENENEINKT